MYWRNSMSLLQDNHVRMEQSTSNGNVSKINPRIHSYIEITYSKTRKAEMKAANEKNCMLLINLLMHRLQSMNATNVMEWTPTNKNRFADIVIEFDIPEDKLDLITESLRETSDSSVEKIELFVEV